MPLLFSLFSLKGTSTYVTLSPYQCRDATTFAMTCCTYKSDAHVWIVNDEEKAFYLGAANTIQIFNTTTSGLNCMAYRRWVNVTNQVIESEIVCKITGGFSNPLIDNFVCKSSNDNTEYCSTKLKTNICFNNVVHSILSTVQENQTSVESSQVKAIVIPIAGNCLSMCMCTHIREISCFSRNPCWEGLKEPCMSRKPTWGLHLTIVACYISTLNERDVYSTTITAGRTQRYAVPMTLYMGHNSHRRCCSHNTRQVQTTVFQ